MVPISNSTIIKYTQDKPQTVKDSFQNWRRIMEGNDFANLAVLRKVFNNVDYVGNDRYVFNILGNNFRLIALIILPEPMLNIIK